jgi:DNA polymerase I-like protein with 3'-5' exonuclease and polymerase domains
MPTSICRELVVRPRKAAGLHALTAPPFLGVASVVATNEARQRAEPVNFGAIDGLGPRSLRVKAKAEYGKDLTEAQAKSSSTSFHRRAIVAQRHQAPEWDRGAGPRRPGGGT